MNDVSIVALDSLTDELIFAKHPKSVRNNARINEADGEVTSSSARALARSHGIETERSGVPLRIKWRRNECVGEMKNVAAQRLEIEIEKAGPVSGLSDSPRPGARAFAANVSDCPG